ncbi:MAG: EamA family transporter [Clostridia bacterium]|nr:EamA family transporter [Clostridia bacterium]
MGYFFILLSKALNQGETMLTRRYSKKHGNGGLFFNSVICLFASVFFFLTDSEGLFFPKEMFWYGTLNALMIAAGFYSVYRAFQLGSYMLTVLITNFSGVIVLIYALFYLKEPANLLRYAAILLTVASIVTVNLEKKEVGQKWVSFKWFLWTMVALFSNGVIGILNREQQIAFDTKCDNEFMLLSFGGAFLFLLVLALLLERSIMCSALRFGALYGAGIGMLNGGKNLLTLISYRHLPVSVSSPVGTGSGMVFSFLVSALIYKEKLKKNQLIGTLLGVAALILMALS